MATCKATGKGLGLHGAQLLLAAVVVARASAYLFSKEGMESFGVFTLLGIRFLLAFSVLVVLFGRRAHLFSWSVMRDGAILGVVYAAVMGLELTALSTETMQSVSFLENSAVVLVPLLEAVLVMRLPHARTIVAVALAITGIGLITLQNGFSLGSGTAAALGAAALYAAAIVLTDRFSHPGRALALGIWQVGFTGACSAAIAFATETPHLPTSTVEWGVVAALVLLCTVFGFAFQPVAQQHLSSEQAGMFCALNPAAATVLGIAFLGEQLTAPAAVGAAFIVCGMLIAAWGDKGRAKSRKTREGKYMENEVSRRSFLKSAGIGAISAAAAMGLGACASPKSKSSSGTSGTVDAANVKWDETFDVVIVGAGIAGLAAAATVATEGNGAKCLVAEKGSMAGGNSPYCGGDALYTKDIDGTFTYLQHMCGSDAFQVTPDDVLKTFAQGISENYDWLKKLGATDDQLVTQGDGATDPDLKGHYFPEYREFPGKESLIGLWFNEKNDDDHKHVYKFLAYFARQHSDAITVRNSAEFTDFVFDSATKQVLGAVIGGKNIKAEKGVIMCLGGFENNPDMMEYYLSEGQAVPSAAQLNTGDGHRACMKIGTDFWHMNHVDGFWMGGRDLKDTQFSNPQTSTKLYKPYGITVGDHGRRFYMDWDGHKQLDDDSEYTTLKQHTGVRHGAMNFGGEWTSLPMPSHGWYIFDANGLAKGAFNKEMSANPVQDGWLLQADTIEELAQKAQLPADELVRTVDQWNGYVAAGADLAFYRPKSTLIPVSTPPYYAQRCRSGLLNTDGGPRRDAQARILDVEGNPIKGLYSAGEFGSVWGLHYQGNGNVSECMVFGRVAVRSALNL